MGCILHPLQLVEEVGWDGRKGRGERIAWMDGWTDSTEGQMDGQDGRDRVGEGESERERLE